MSEKLQINIIYAEADNKPIVDNRGWVSYFEKFLYMMLKQTMNRTVQIQLISDSSGQKNADDGLQILILSPNFILSGICLDRLENIFLNNHSENIQSTVFPIYKSPLSYQDIPQKLKGLRSFLFYLNDENREQELSDFFSKEAEKGYWMKMVDLCFDIYESFVIIKEKEKVDEQHGRKAIYLAETGQDLSGARNIIKRELTRHGYEVYPKSLLPHTVSEVEKSVQADLKKCIFSIHMIGSSYGVIPDGTESSVMDIQNSLAADFTEKHSENFNRLIWISPSLKYASEKQKSFIHNIKRDSKASLGAEVLQTSLEDFKNTLWQELLDKGKRQLRNSHSHESQEKPIIYLIYDEIDAKAAKRLKKEIQEQNVETISLENKGELMDLRNKHIDALKQMDAAIVFQENVNSQWVYMKLLDLLKAPGFGRSKPLLGKLLKSEKANNSDFEYIRNYEVALDTSKDSNTLNKFIHSIKLAFEESRVKMAE
jgi:hypothetical protein